MRPFLLALLGITACASPPPPTVQVSAARAAIEQAGSSVAHYAPAELAAAQAKLERAEQALARGDSTQARRLSEEAEVDARLASAMAENERSRGMK
jgi:predicted Zn-dependent protease